MMKTIKFLALAMMCAHGVYATNAYDGLLLNNLFQNREAFDLMQEVVRQQENTNSNSERLTHSLLSILNAQHRSQAEIVNDIARYIGLGAFSDTDLRVLNDIVEAIQDDSFARQGLQQIAKKPNNSQKKEEKKKESSEDSNSDSDSDSAERRNPYDELTDEQQQDILESLAYIDTEEYENLPFTSINIDNNSSSQNNVVIYRGGRASRLPADTDREAINNYSNRGLMINLSFREDTPRLEKLPPKILRNIIFMSALDNTVEIRKLLKCFSNYRLLSQYFKTFIDYYCFKRPMSICGIFPIGELLNRVYQVIGNIQHLNLENLGLQSLDGLNLNQFTDLQTLDLTGNEITDLTPLLSLPNLRSVTIPFAISDEAAAQFQKDYEEKHHHSIKIQSRLY